MFDKILVAYDSSPHANEALTYAIALAEKCKSKISLLYVIKPTSLVAAMPIEGAVATIDIAEERKRAEEEAKRLLDQGKKLAKKKGVRAEAVLSEGDPAETIVKTAREERFELIVMGARGLGKIKSILLGSVSSGVVQKADRPVLIVKKSVG